MGRYVLSLLFVLWPIVGRRLFGALLDCKMTAQDDEGVKQDKRDIAWYAVTAYNAIIGSLVAVVICIESAVSLKMRPEVVGTLLAVGVFLVVSFAVWLATE